MKAGRSPAAPSSPPQRQQQQRSPAAARSPTHNRASPGRKRGACSQADAGASARARKRLNLGSADGIAGRDEVESEGDEASDEQLEDARADDDGSGGRDADGGDDDFFNRDACADASPGAGAGTSGYVTAPVAPTAVARPAVNGDAIRAAMRAAMGRSMGGGLTIAAAAPAEPNESAGRGVDASATERGTGTACAPGTDEAEQEEEEEEEGGNGRAYIEATRKQGASGSTAKGSKGAKGAKGAARTKTNNRAASAPLNESLLADDAAVAAALATLPDKHAAARAELFEVYEHESAQWALRLRAGSSLLFHGFGSKRKLLDEFVARSCSDGSVLEVDGFEQALTARDVLRAAATIAREHAAAVANANAATGSAVDAEGVAVGAAISGMSNAELCAVVRAAMHLPGVDPRAEENGSSVPMPPLYLVVHSIDGPSLRSAEAQAQLAELAACTHVRVVASVDHLNAALLWDREALGRFRWSWIEAPTWAPYTSEARSFAPLVAPRAEGRRAQGALQVLQSLTPNARGIFRMLIDRCNAQAQAAATAGGRGGGAIGISFHALYEACRERFLCSSQATLKSVLTEFADHELVRERRTAGTGERTGGERGGGDLIQVALPKAALSSVLEAMDAA